MGNYGIKVSGHGKDVKTASGEDLVVDSKKKCFKIGEVNHTTITTDEYGQYNGLLATHNLGFIPSTEIAIVVNGTLILEPIYDNNDHIYFYAETGVAEINIQLSIYSAPNTTYDIYLWLSEAENSL